MGCGPGCSLPMECNDCDGCGTAAAYPVMRPFDRVRNFKRQLICGSGCGERYVGEWISTPPDCQDPCCGDQWVGGARRSRPFCWQPGALFGNLYGSRFCEGAESSVPCGCGGVCDGSCGGIVDGGYIDGPVTESANGCSTCSSSGSVVSRMRSAQRTPAVDPMTRSARTMNPRADNLVR